MFCPVSSSTCNSVLIVFFSSTTASIRLLTFTDLEKRF
jgi:hypothetical protein